MGLIFFVIFVAGVTAVITAIVMTRRSRAVHQALRLPQPGPNLELYERVKNLLDGVAEERRAALAEVEQLRARLEGMRESRDWHATRLKTVDGILKELVDGPQKEEVRRPVRTDSVADYGGFTAVERETVRNGGFVHG